MVSTDRQHSHNPKPDRQDWRNKEIRQVRTSWDKEQRERVHRLTAGAGSTQGKRPSLIQEKFAELVERWRNETRAMAMVREMVLLPSYQQIIGLGPDVIPLLLRELRDHPHHWFWALRAITGEDPVPGDSAGNVQRMAEAWLEWGRQNGYTEQSG